MNNLESKIALAKSVINYLECEDSTKFSSDQLESSKNFYHGKPIGKFSPRPRWLSIAKEVDNR